MLLGGGRPAAADAGGGPAAASGHRGVHAGAHDRPRAELDERGPGRRGSRDFRRGRSLAGAWIHRGTARAAAAVSGEAADAAVFGDDDGRRVGFDQFVAAEAGSRVRGPGESSRGSLGAGASNRERE